MRIAKFMAAAGIASRRKSEEIVKKGYVKVNGKAIHDPATGVDPQHDIVEVYGKQVEIPQEKVYLMLNKPVGCVSTCSDEKGRKTVLDYVKDIHVRVYPVGRLDFTTEGLLLLTNDGELANKLMHPSHEVAKRYFCVVNSMVSAQDAEKLQKGVFIEGGKTAPARIKIIRATPERTELTISIHEGRNRQVRRMFEALDKEVVFLKRISIGELTLGNLKRGEYRMLEQSEIDYLHSIL